jgi:hypothetical protein
MKFVQEALFQISSASYNSLQFWISIWLSGVTIQFKIRCPRLEPKKGVSFSSFPDYCLCYCNEEMMTVVADAFSPLFSRRFILFLEVGIQKLKSCFPQLGISVGWGIVWLTEWSFR